MYDLNFLWLTLLCLFWQLTTIQAAILTHLNADTFALAEQPFVDAAAILVSSMMYATTFLHRWHYINIHVIFAVFGAEWIFS